VTANAYSHDKPRTYHVPARRTAVHTAEPLRTSGGWYDLTVTASTDSTWSQRYVGHLENGGPSITGACDRLAGQDTTPANRPLPAPRTPGLPATERHHGRPETAGCPAGIGGAQCGRLIRQNGWPAGSA
jgi:phospholipase C-like protein